MRVCTLPTESRDANASRGERAALNERATDPDTPCAPECVRPEPLPTDDELAVVHDSLCELLGLPDTRWELAE